MMMGGIYPTDYSGEKLREAVEEATEQISEDIDKVETPDFTHECQSCGMLAEVDDHQKHTPNWCEDCESIQTFEKLK